MDFDSPDVMKDFPGLYASELNKKCNNDSDYSDEPEKSMKKDMLIGKRKDKKDKKDKERGYAALEGESSADEASKSRSPSKSKKTKSFKFTTKSKEKREKSREKDKDNVDKKKDRDKKSEKKIDKGKKLKQSVDEAIDIAEGLPIFGVNLEICVQRSRCHDGVDLPVPVRECIDYIETVGISFEGVYKISGTKSKVLQIKKMYNQRQDVNLNDYDVPTATSLLKMFLRELPEPLFTNDLLIRFEEAGAILNFNTREKHLKILVDNLLPNNKLLLSWLIIHLDNIALGEKQNKMNRQSLSAALNHTFHCSSRLLLALIHHSRSLFPDVVITKYLPPLTSGLEHLSADDLPLMEIELGKQESLLTQIHKEMNVGCISKHREELLWEVQRIITQLKRKIKTAHRDRETASSEKVEEKMTGSCEETPKDISAAPVVEELEEVAQPPPLVEAIVAEMSEATSETTAEVQDVSPKSSNNLSDKEHNISDDLSNKCEGCFSDDNNIQLMQLKNAGLLKLKETLIKNVQAEKSEIASLRAQLQTEEMTQPPVVGNPECLDEIMSLLQKENQILQIKKINLVRNIIEQQEICIELGAKLELFQL